MYIVGNLRTIHDWIDILHFAINFDVVHSSVMHNYTNPC